MRADAVISERARRRIASLFLGVFVLHALLSFYLLARLPIWSPRDELAHFDYIEVLSTGHWPSTAGTITDLSFQFSVRSGFWRAPEGFDGTKVGMKAAGRSYESQQPPLYYLALAPVHALLKAFQAEPVRHIVILRSVQFLFVLAGALMAIPVFRELETQFGLDRLWGYPMACWLAMAATMTGTQLSNDNLSLLACNGALYCMLRALREPTLRWNGWSAAAVVAAFAVKYTNGWMLVLFFALQAFLRLRRRVPGVLSFRAVAVAPAVLVTAGLCLNRVLTGEVFFASETRNYFAGWVHPIPHWYESLRSVAWDLTDLKHLGLHPPAVAGWVLLGLIVFNAAGAWARKRRGVDSPATSIVLVAAMVVAAFLFSSAILNAFVEGVHWGVARHYNGYALCWWSAVMMFPVSLPPRTGRIAMGGAAVVLLSGCVWFAYRLMVVFGPPR